MASRSQLFVQALGKHHLFRWQDTDTELSTALPSWRSFERAPVDDFMIAMEDPWETEIAVVS